LQKVYIESALPSDFDIRRQIIWTISSMGAGGDKSFECLARLAAENQNAILRPETVGADTQIEAAILDGIRQAKFGKNLSAETDICVLAALYHVILLGMATAARDGATDEKLLKIARAAASAWPR
jgi:hypothetical protein